MRRLLAVIALASVSLAGCASNAETFTAPAVPAMSAAGVLADVEYFSGTYGERADNLAAHTGARDWLAQQFAEAGLEVWRQPFTDGIDQENIIGIHWGQDRDDWVVVGGHYDTAGKSCPSFGLTGDAPDEVDDARRECSGPIRARSEGAYDDGSGTMMTLHLARAFAQLQPYYTIAFVMFDGEERGLQGSKNFTETMMSGEHPYGDVRIRAMLDLDMFGINWPGTQSPIYFDENSDELRAFVESYRDELGIPENMIRYQGISLGRSDYHWFFQMGVPTGFFISSFEEWDLPAGAPLTVTPTGTAGDTGYPFWHLEDTYETMELMAGSAADLEAGFQVAVDLAAGVLHFMSAHPETFMDVRVS